MLASWPSPFSALEAPPDHEDLQKAQQRDERRNEYQGEMKEKVRVIVPGNPTRRHEWYHVQPDQFEDNREFADRDHELEHKGPIAVPPKPLQQDVQQVENDAD